MSAVDEALAAARDYPQRYPGGSMAAVPRRRLAVLTCMDARIDPAAVLGLAVGDAHVLRNPGGTVTPSELRALAVSQRELGTTEIAVVQHTRCGMRGFRDAPFRAAVAAETGTEPGWPDAELLDDPAADVRACLARITGEPAIPHRDAVRGFVFDVDTGVLTEVG